VQVLQFQVHVDFSEEMSASDHIPIFADLSTSVPKA